MGENSNLNFCMFKGYADQLSAIKSAFTIVYDLLKYLKIRGGIICKFYIIVKVCAPLINKLFAQALRFNMMTVYSCTCVITGVVYQLDRAPNYFLYII